MMTTNTLTDKITFAFVDSESGARDFVKFLVDSGILDIEVNFANRENVKGECDDLICEFPNSVVVSYWIDTMGIEVGESVRLGEEFISSINGEFWGVFYNDIMLGKYRLCNCCGKPMKEGYKWGDEFYCSKECLDATYTQEEQDKDMYMLDEGETLSNPPTDSQMRRFEIQDECYWTEWDSIMLDDE